jgi:lysophospholipase L1-like esterase
MSPLLMPRLAAAPQGAVLVPPDHQGLEWTGRIDRSNPKALVLIWQGTELRCSFTGTRIGFLFGKGRERNFFNAAIDGQIHVIKIGDDAEAAYAPAEKLPQGKHELILYKRSEAAMGQAPFLGLLLEPGAEILPKPQKRTLKLEFYGDSITAGACDEDPGADQYDDLSTHNHYRSYGAITARNLGAESVSISVSGIGICESWDPRVMGQIWDRLYCDPEGRPWDFSGPEPDAVIINLGQNDFGFPDFHWKPFPPDFRKRYVDFVRGIRARYRGARIFCVLGGMRCYEESPALRGAFDGALGELAREDALVSSYVFKAWAPGHPRVDVHERMANELTALIVGTMFERRASPPRGPRS